MSDNTVAPDAANEPTGRSSDATDAARSGGISGLLRDFAAQFDPILESHLTPRDDVPNLLQQAVRYAALAPGKRIRPFLLVRCCELVGSKRDAAFFSACAIECVHAFSLVHDDLPAMDDDDLRRGRPTCHRAFDEATAILAGDALLTMAFQLLADQPVPAERSLHMIKELAEGTGWCGMIGGQAADIDGERQPPSEQLARFIHERKTAALFRAACRLGAIAGGGQATQIEALGLYGHHLGVAFQIADDLLDVGAADHEMGKRTGKDADSGKQSFPRCVGVEASRDAAARATNEALACLNPFGSDAEDLRALAGYVVDRNY